MRLSRPEDYRGFVDITVKLLVDDPEINAVNRKVVNYQDILEADKNLEPFLRRFSKTRAEFAWSIKKYIPNICLIKNSRINESQETLFHGITNNYPNEFAVILYNGNGIKMKYPGMPDQIVYNRKTIRPSMNVNLDITEALQFLKEVGDVKSFPRIVIIAGELAGRCISYVSRDYDWHLTDMYYNPAKSTPIPEMIQSCGRLCGRNRGKSHLHLHCTKRVADALYDGFHFTNEIIERAIASPLLHEDGEISFSKSVKAVPMNKEKFPKGREMTSKVEIKRKDFNLVKGDDKGFGLDKYKYSEGEGQEEDKKEEYEIDNGEFIRLTTKMFPLWSRSNNKIAAFMKNLQPSKVYTEEEIKNLCIISGVRLYDVIKKHKNIYGDIIKKDDNKYYLNTCLVQSFNKYFSK